MNYNTQRYHYMKSQGRCPYCGDKKDESKYVLCAACRQRERERQQTRRDEETAFAHFRRCEENRINQQKRRERLRAEGKCPYCGKPALPGHVLCPEHNEENNRKARERWLKAKSATGKEADRA